MVKKTAYGSVKRLGARYGRTIKFKLGKIEAEQRKKHKCPYCNYDQVRRKALGIWYCKKCKATFTNKAYTVGKLGPLIKPVEEQEMPLMAEEVKEEVKQEPEKINESKKQEADASE
jgi:large subunit ribosomal protein L37Ae